MFYYVLLFQHDPRQSLQQLTLLQPNLAADSVAKDVAVLALAIHGFSEVHPMARQDLGLHGPQVTSFESFHLLFAEARGPLEDVDLHIPVHLLVVFAIFLCQLLANGCLLFIHLYWMCCLLGNLLGKPLLVHLLQIGGLQVLFQRLILVEALPQFLVLDVPRIEVLSHLLSFLHLLGDLLGIARLAQRSPHGLERSVSGAG
mmetsp:Transcript_50144/g.80060  ORF Transcript_50144/g.80060 Transcript_50144/m.80060 type:complete len:201 (-) Transcript_50144:17-619(-)